MENKIIQAVANGGILADVPLANRAGCASVAIIYPPEVSERLEQFSRDLAQVSPSIIYHAEDVHSTVGKCAVSESSFYFQPSNERDGKLFEILTDSVYEEVLPKKKWRINIAFCGYLCLRTVVVLLAKPNSHFFQLADSLKEACKKRGVELSPPSVIDGMIGITLGRFMKNVRPDGLSDLFSFIKSARAPAEKTSAFGLCAGYSAWTPIAEKENCSGKLHGHFVSRLSMNF